MIEHSSNKPAIISVSIVSHGHGEMVSQLVNGLLLRAEISEIIVTKNIPETLHFPENKKLKVINNSLPNGFATNHNNAFLLSSSPYFLVLNPDMEINGLNIIELVNCMDKYGAGLISPLIYNKNGELEDSVRYFPSFISIVKKLFIGDKGNYPVDFNKEVIFPEWVAGMFMLFSKASFKRINGFDDGFYLYYEDVDICWRLSNCGIKVATSTIHSAVHDARRHSRTKIKFFSYHLRSLMRFLLKSKLSKFKFR